MAEKPPLLTAIHQERADHSGGELNKFTGSPYVRPLFPVLSMGQY